MTDQTIHDQTNILVGSRLVVVFVTLASALLLTHTDQSSVGVALPTIGDDLGSASTAVWAGTSAMIANTAFQPLHGRLSDILGRKGLLIVCCCLLGIADLLCGFAQTGPQLYAYRGISGVASGGVLALVMMIVSDVTTLEQRGKYQGILGSCVGLGNTIGPFLGAVFTRYVTWRATFWLMAPMAVAEGVLLYFLLPSQTIPQEPLSVKLKKIDWLGVLLSCSGTILLMIPISGIGTQFSTSDPGTIAMLTIGAFLLAAFVVYQWKGPELPIIPLRLLRNMALAAIFAQNFLVGNVFFGLLYFLPIYFQTARQTGLLVSAVLIIPLVMAQAIASALSGQYISRTGRYGEVIWAGYISWFAGTALHYTFSKTIPLVAIVFILMLEGFGVGLTFQPSLVAAQAHSPKEDRAVVIGSRNFIRGLGGSAGLAIGSAIYSRAMIQALHPQVPESISEQIRNGVFSLPDLSLASPAQRELVLDAYMTACRSVFYLWIGAMGVTLFLMLFVRDEGLKRDEEIMKEELPSVAQGTSVLESTGGWIVTKSRARSEC